MTILKQLGGVRKSQLALAAALTAFSLSFGCGGGGGGAHGAVTDNSLIGTWGGTDTGSAAQPATLGVTSTGGSLTLPCGAGGKIDQALTLDAGGHFSATGTYTGSVVMPAPNAIPAVYSGTISGNRMALTVTNGNNQREIGTYALVNGQTAPVFRGVCPG